MLIVVPVYLIKRQPDLGTALLIGASGFYVLFLAGLSWKVIVGLAALAGAVGPAVWASPERACRRSQWPVALSRPV